MKNNLVRRVDSAGRILMGREFRRKQFHVQALPNGDIVLSPVLIRDEREAWLFENPTALEAVRRGLEQSACGETYDLGDFAEYFERPKRTAKHIRPKHL